MVTFGDLLAVAQDHLTEANLKLRGPDGQASAQNPAVVAELARFTGVLGRYSDAISTGFGDSPTSDTEIRDAARHAGVLIRQAQEVLGDPSGDEPPASPLAEHLRAGSIAFGCGLDLLATQSSAPGSADTAVITAEDTTRTLLKLLTEHIRNVADIVRHLEPPPSEACTPLLRAASITVDPSGHGPSLIGAVPLRQVPERVPPRVGEDPHEARAGVDITAQRLWNSSFAGSAGTWPYVTRAAAVVGDIAHLIVNRLSIRMAELEEHEHASQLHEAAKEVLKTTLRWKTISRRWANLADRNGHTSGAVTTDTSDLVVRLGRIIFVAPDWSPGPKAVYRVKEPELLARTATDAALVGVTTLRALEACTGLALNHRQAANDAAILHKTRQRKPNPGPPWAARVLLTRYEALAEQSRKAVHTFGTAIQPLASESPPIEQEVALILSRVTAADPRSPSSIASRDFPLPPSEIVSPRTMQPPAATRQEASARQLPLPSSQRPL